jgi:hypothetical protein
MKKVGLCLVACLMVASAAFAAWPSDPPGNITYVMPELASAPTVDGTEDSVWDAVPWVQMNVNKVQPNTIADAADFDGYVKFGYFGNDVYMLAKITDDTWEVNTGVWNDDELEVYLSLTGSILDPASGIDSVNGWDTAAGPAQFFLAPDERLPNALFEPDPGLIPMIDDNTVLKDANTGGVQRCVMAVGGDDVSAGGPGTVWYEAKFIPPATVNLSAEVGSAFPFMVAFNDQDAVNTLQFPSWWGLAGDPWMNKPADSSGAQWNLPADWAAAMLANTDTDGDGLVDEMESDGSTYAPFTGTSATLADTDGDGWNDGAEVAADTDPLDAQDHPAGNPPGVPVAGVAALIALAGATIAAAARKLR